MANRSYVTVADIKDTLGVTSSTDDALMLKIAEGGTAKIENYTHRKFNVEVATKYYTGANIVWFDDLLTVSTVKVDEDADGTFESTLTTSDYVLFPLNDYPKTYIEVTESGDYGTFAYGVRKGIEILGEWGYGDGESSSPIIAGSKTASAAMAASATTLTVQANYNNLEAGQTIKIDSEQFYVSGIPITSTASIANIMPAQNGTSATSHVASSVIYLYQYPSDIWNACLNLAIAEYQNRDKKGLKSEALGDYRYTLDTNQTQNILADNIPPAYVRRKF